MLCELASFVDAQCVCVCLSHSDCVFDLCAERGSAALRCASYEAYAVACQEAGVKLGAWRQKLDCGTILNTHKKPRYIHIMWDVMTVVTFSEQKT